MPVGEKPAIMPNLAHFLRTTTVGNVPSLLIAAVVGAAAALMPHRKSMARRHVRGRVVSRQERVAVMASPTG